MKINKVTKVIFSPTGSTKNVADIIANELFNKSETIDITSFSANRETISFSDEELVIFGIPVYGGRVPSIAAYSLETFKGNNTPALIFCTYGNRNYDDALLELSNILEKNGFIIISAAAFITEHNIMHSVGKNRPDESDISIIKSFAKESLEKTNCVTDIPNYKKIEIEGNVPYRNYGGLPLKPKASSKCTKCGICAKNCPVGAISKENLGQTDKEKCITCMGCILNCPVKVRNVNKFMQQVAEKSFFKKYSDRKEPEIFI